MKEVIGMRVIVSKPSGGKVDLRVDDRYGATGLNLVERGVPVEQAETAVALLIKQWEDRRKAVTDARKGVSA